MTQAERYINTGEYPFTGIRDASFDARVSEKPFLDNFFNGTPHYDQVSGVTRGKVYHVHKVEGFGDASSFFITDDTGKEHELGDMFFEAVD